ncbi:MAG TPA: hypothetical protein VFC19_12695 [Candidatus Limnocylindrales bacterium]|nr:hypothetical protein [Candidatus Limnocylindrales bacterium]
MDKTALTLGEIEAALKACWAADTCSPDDLERAGWSPENPAWGHCDVTAMLLNDIFGGDLVVGEVFAGTEQQGYHWWNRLDSGVEIDLTRSQFRQGQRVVEAKAMKRPAGRRPRRHEEYLLLRKRVETHLGRLPGSWE